MAMTIQHDGSAMLTLGEVAKNNSAMTKNLKKLASGQKINSAGDDASGYAISEKMRVRIRALEQDTRNTQTGSSMLRVAEGGVQSIIDELRTLKELALNAANDHNTDLDRATIQKEFDQRRANIDNIAVETNYNGKILLDGSYKAVIEVGVPRLVSTDTTQTTDVVGPVTTTSTAQTGSTGPTSTTETLSDVTTGPVRQDTAPTTGTTSSTVNDPTSTVTTTVGTTGPTALPPTATTNTTRTTDADTPTEGQTTETITTTDVTVEVSESTETKRTTTTDVSTTTTTTVTSTPVEVEVDVTPTTITNGTTEITTGGVYKFAAGYTGTLTISASDVTLIGAGSQLTDVYIVDNGVDTLTIKDLNIKNTQDKSAISFSGTGNKLRLLGTNTIESDSTVTTMSKAIIFAGGGLSIVGNDENGHPGGGLTLIAHNTATYSKAAVIGGNNVVGCGDISIGQGVTINITQNNGTCIGSGSSASVCGNISIGTGANVTVTTSSGASAAIGAQTLNSRCGNITIYSGATVTATASGGVGIGCSATNSTCGNIIIYDGANVTTSGILTSAGKTITNPATPAQSGGELDTTNPLKTKVTKYDVTTRVVTTKTTTVSTVDNTTTTRDTTTTTVTDVTTNVFDDAPTDEGERLVIHHDTKANTAMHVHLEDMRTAALKSEIPNEEDLEQLSKLKEPERSALQAVLDEAKDKSLADTSVSSQKSANVTIRVVDGAIQYALDQATTIGAYIARLNFTEANLVTATENTIQSESTIRDADMAKEMAEYTKNNVLLQASQSMLAQANQNTSTVLGLLQ